MFIVQVAAVSCAATHVPESKTANHSFRYSGFRSAAKVEVLLGLSFTGVITVANLELLKNPERSLPPLRKNVSAREKQNLHTSLPDDTGNGSSLFPVSCFTPETNGFRGN
jgi:hypothetical protein